jgi:hypothetical protein
MQSQAKNSHDVQTNEILLRFGRHFTFTFPSTFLNMGHRAKNKQAAPEPYEPSPKKLGKRKADGDERSNARPPKKIKDAHGNGKPKAPKPTADIPGKKTKATKKPKQPVDSDPASEGWEDVEDGAKYVSVSSYLFSLAHRVFG